MKIEMSEWDCGFDLTLIAENQKEAAQLAMFGLKPRRTGTRENRRMI